MKSFEEMLVLAKSKYKIETTRDSYDNEIDSVKATMSGFVVVEPSINVEPEDAIWRRDLSGIFDDGILLGMNAMYQAFSDSLSIEVKAKIANEEDEFYQCPEEYARLNGVKE